jgi:hypothetical protein
MSSNRLHRIHEEDEYEQYHQPVDRVRYERPRRGRSSIQMPSIGYIMKWVLVIMFVIVPLYTFWSCVLGCVGCVTCSNFSVNS